MLRANVPMRLVVASLSTSSRALAFPSQQQAKVVSTEHNKMQTSAAKNTMKLVTFGNSDFGFTRSRVEEKVDSRPLDAVEKVADLIARDWQSAGKRMNSYGA